jgi:pimeloyl-ACP methyl ester carboxylesterase
LTVHPLRRLVVGNGPPLVLLHGFAMQPRTYLPLAQLLADRVRVVIPAIFDCPGGWRFSRVLDDLEATLDEEGLDQVSLLGHSFGGGIELGFAARHPDRVLECVFADTLAVRERFSLAGEALHDPFGILKMATAPAASAFFQSIFTHPLQLATAGLWGFITDRTGDMERVVAAGVPCHVLWANRDTLLARSDGEEFATFLNATFTVAADPVVDHDWMFDDPELFVEHLESLHLRVLSRGDRPSRRGGRRRGTTRPPAHRGVPRSADVSVRRPR